MITSIRNTLPGILVAIFILFTSLQASVPAIQQLADTTREPVKLNSDSLNASIHPDSLANLEDSLKIGLALSGGGARGLAHIGVLRELEKHGLKIDYIAGSSMGSIIGGLYAMGYSADQLVELEKSLNWDRLFNENVKRSSRSMHERLLNESFQVSLPIDQQGIHLPEGLITGQNIHNLLSRLCWPYHEVSNFSNLPIPFAATATNLANGDLVVLDHGYLPDALRASMGIPTIFTPYRIDDKILIDGGVARSIPASEVREMGADFIISVNVTKQLKPVDSLRSLTSIMNQVINIRDNRDFQRQLEFTDLLIEPEVVKFSISDFKHADELIELGQAATRPHGKILQRLPEDTVRDRKTQDKPGTPAMNARRFSELEIRGLQDLSRELVMQTFDLSLPKDLRHSDIKNAIDELYNTQLFSLVTYRTQPLPNGTHKLILNISEKNQDQFKLGVRYDTDTQVSLISQFSFRNLFHDGSLVRLEARLGEITSITGEYTVFRGLRPRMGIRSLVNYQRNSLTWHHNGNQVTPFVSHHITAEVSTGNFFSSKLLMSGGIRKELLYLDHTSNLPFSRNRSYHTLFGRVWYDTFDHLTFPSEGQMMLGEITYSDDIFYSPLDYSQQHFYWSAAIPILHNLTVKPEFRLGRTTGSQLPASEWFYLQRMDPLLGYLRFMGYRNREVHGRNLQLAGLGVQWEIAENKFIKLQSQIGNTFSHWPWDPWNHPLKRGVGLSVGAKTFAGPLELTVSGSQHHPLLIFFQMGYSF